MPPKRKSRGDEQQAASSKRRRLSEADANQASAEDNAEDQQQPKVDGRRRSSRNSTRTQKPEQRTAAVAAPSSPTPQRRSTASKPAKTAAEPAQSKKQNPKTHSRSRKIEKKAETTTDETPVLTSAKSPVIAAEVVKAAEQLERAPGERCFWLMKAEPESRLERGVDVKFSIDDLAAREEPEPWDGVRNPVAQKIMRSMRTGELAFFYHSNCKVPGIAGVMQIVREQTPDPSAFDPKHPYYDPKSDPSRPKWCVVHVRFVTKFDRLVSLEQLKEYAKSAGESGRKTPPLENLQTLKMARLSVSRVMPEEWRFILELAGVQEREIEAAVEKLGPVEE